MREAIHLRPPNAEGKNVWGHTQYLLLPHRYSRRCAQLSTGATLPFHLQTQEEEEKEEEG